MLKAAPLSNVYITSEAHIAHPRSRDEQRRPPIVATFTSCFANHSSLRCTMFDDLDIPHALANAKAVGHLL